MRVGDGAVGVTKTVRSDGVLRSDPLIGLCQRRGVNWVTRVDRVDRGDEYPAITRFIHHPPFMSFAQQRKGLLRQWRDVLALVQMAGLPDYITPVGPFCEAWTCNSRPGTSPSSYLPSIAMGRRKASLSFRRNTGVEGNIVICGYFFSKRKITRKYTRSRLRNEWNTTDDSRLKIELKY